MNKFFACNSSNNLALKVLDTLNNLEQSQDHYFVYVSKRDEGLWSLIPPIHNATIIDEADLSNLPPITSFYSLNNPYLNKGLIKRLNPENVYFNNKDQSRVSKVLLESEIYYLKFLKSNINLFTFQDILATTMGKKLIDYPFHSFSFNQFGVLITELESNDEVFFWRKLISFIATISNVRIYTTTQIANTMKSFGELPNSSFLDLDDYSNENSTLWVTQDSKWKFILNLNKQKTIAINNPNFQVQSTTWGPHAIQFASSLNMEGFVKIKSFFLSLKDNSYKGAQVWDSKIGTWANPCESQIDFQSLVLNMYYLYWNFYLKEKELYFNPGEISPSINQQVVTLFMQSLVDIHTLMANLKNLASERTDINDFEYDIIEL